MGSMNGFADLLTNFVSSDFNRFVSFATATLSAAALNLMLRSNREAKIKSKEVDKFSNVLLQGLKLGTINNLDDVYNIYKGINDYELVNENYRYSLNKSLRKFLVKIQTEEFEDIEEEDIKRWKSKVDEFIKKNEELSPFSELPQAERNIMNDILAYLDKNDNESIRRKIMELSNSIQIRKEQIDKIDKQNKWSVPLAVIGLVLTIFFGIASLI
ncbi:hypothetical protein [Bacillus cereus group sp. BY8-1LC]|uniref:hypothetical protein n=1 Tax=Bacillus cereus group sp. BY8-1LC TaxID=3018076 RepID=UPI0022E294A5|nr:hypothetical protein [Bacillus cereus group sp. BY8-1LC]MDA1795692.1 hypothetical protein [Bacillus cereus group sp. BY8-1LC]